MEPENREYIKHHLFLRDLSFLTIGRVLAAFNHLSIGELVKRLRACDGIVQSTYFLLYRGYLKK
jgi:hypothetical protein